MKTMSRTTKIFAFSVVTACLSCGIWLAYALNGMASLEPGMITLHLPTGANAYVRRQAYFSKPADVYISASDDFCKPFDRWHDYKLTEPIHAGPESPLFVSYSGDTIIVHSPGKLHTPLLKAPPSFKVALQQLSTEKYFAYVATEPTTNTQLPIGWSRLEIPFGNNTCAL